MPAAIIGALAQSVEQKPFKLLVVGSIPTRPTINRRFGHSAQNQGPRASLISATSFSS